MDSGADVNVFDVEIAIALGLNLKAGEAVDIVTVMGGVETVYFHPVTITVGGTRIETRGVPGALLRRGRSERLLRPLHHQL